MGNFDSLKYVHVESCMLVLCFGVCPEVPCAARPSIWIVRGGIGRIYRSMQGVSLVRLWGDFVVGGGFYMLS
jgi:hypothetical protein